jgi:hypothetical protein
VQNLIQTRQRHLNIKISAYSTKLVPRLERAGPIHTETCVLMLGTVRSTLIQKSSGDDTKKKQEGRLGIKALLWAAVESRMVRVRARIGTGAVDRRSDGTMLKMADDVVMSTVKKGRRVHTSGDVKEQTRDNRSATGSRLSQ